MTLTQTAALTKKAMWGMAALILIGAILFVSYQIYYYDYYLPHLPKKVELPTVKFAILPKINLNEASKSSSNYTYTLDTQTGELPGGFPNILRVYFVPQLGTTLLAPDRVQSLAHRLGFPNGPTIVGDTEYHFTDSNGGKLTIDLNSANFSYTRPATNSAALMDPTLGDQTKLIADFKSYLGNKGLFDPGLQNGRTNVSYDQSTFTDASQADISLWPGDLDYGHGKIPIVTPTFSTSLINATVTRANVEMYRYIRMQYVFWNPDPQSASTYPIKSVTDAFNELKAGQGYIISPPTTSTASITQVYLAYLETESYSPYIQPVYVFQGPSLVAYVPAITSQYEGK